MQRAILPTVLASLGLFLIFLSTVFPFLEWDVKLNADFSPIYRIDSLPSPWTTKLGESMDDRVYTFKKVQVFIGEAVCTNDEEYLAVQRSPNEKSLESTSVNIHNYTPWLILLSLIEVLLSGVYIWWLTIQQDHPSISSAICPVVISLVFFCLLVAAFRLIDPKLSAPQYLMMSDQCQGILTLVVRLSRIHYEVPTVIGLGILGEVLAFGIMLRQLIMAIIQRKESSRSAAGYRLTAVSRDKGQEDQNKK